MDALSIMKRLKAEKAAAAQRAPASPAAPASGSALSTDARATSEVAALDFGFESISRHHLPLPRVSYVNAALSPSNCGVLLAAVDAAPADAWIVLRARRLQNWGGTVTPQGLTSVSPLPPWLDRLAALLVRAGVFPGERSSAHIVCCHELTCH